MAKLSPKVKNTVKGTIGIASLMIVGLFFCLGVAFQLPKTFYFMLRSSNPILNDPVTCLILAGLVIGAFAGVFSLAWDGLMKQVKTKSPQ